MSQSHCHCDDHDVSADEGDRNSEGSVCQPVTPGNHPASPISCYESISVKSDDYLDHIFIMPHRKSRLVTAQNLVFDPISIRRELALMVILHEYPLSIIHHDGFRRLFSNVNPLFKMVSQETLWNDIMKIRKFERCIAISELGTSSSGRVAVTIKMWDSCDGKKKFLAITGHMVDGQWERESYIMRFANVPVQCSNEVIVKVIAECLSEFDVDEKLATITMDNHTSNDELADILQKKLSKNKFLLGGKLFKIPCFAQTMSLMVQDGFDVISGVIDKIRDSIHFWTDSQEREAEFKKATRDLGLSTAVALVLDYDSNWNSTFLMMQQSILLKNVFVHLKNQEAEYNSLPTENEWDLVGQVCQRLEEFYNLMKAFEKPPASCLYYMFICTIKLSLSEWRNSETMEVKNMALRMSEKFEKYWHAAHDFLAVAAVFHPYFQLFDVADLFPKLYGDEAESELERIRKICYELYYEYKSSMPVDPVDDVEEKSPTSSRDSFRTYMRKKRRKLSERCELDLYFQSDEFVKPDEIISWWENCSRFPILQKIAKDILAIPVFSVDYENVFLLGDPVLSPTRSRLNPTMVETLMCTQSWVRNRRRYESRKTEPSTVTSKHSMGTIYDDANAEQGIFCKVKSGESGSTSDSR